MKSSKLNFKLKVVCFAVYLFLILVISIMIALNSDYKNALYEFFQKINSDDWGLKIKMMAISITLILLGFPLSVFKIMIGYLVRNLILAQIICLITHVTSASILFFIIRHFFKQTIMDAFGNTTKFMVINGLLEKQRYKSLLLINFIALPGFFKIAFQAVLQIPYWQFITFLSLSSMVFNFLLVLKGKYLRLITLNQSEDNPYKQIEILFFVFLYICIFYLLYKFRKDYNQLKNIIKIQKQNENYIQESKDQEDQNQLIEN